jgi:hypothetical protein
MRLAPAALLLMLCTPAWAQSGPVCEVFTRDDRAASALVHEWLANSHDLRVQVCHVPAADGETSEQYAGEGATTRHGGVCSYPSHGLTPTGPGGARRLQRYEQGEGLAMTLQPSGACPAEHVAGVARYTLTYELSAETFSSLMQWWLAAESSPQAFDSAGPVSGDAAHRAAARFALPPPLFRLHRRPGQSCARRGPLRAVREQTPARALAAHRGRRNQPLKSYLAHSPRRRALMLEAMCWP